MSSSQKKIKILIVDDQKLVRETLKIYFTSQPNLEVVDCAASGVIALKKIDKLKPDIVLIDLEMPGMSGIITIEIISDRYPDIKALVLSTHEEKNYINQAVSAGARGYFLKGTNPEDLVAAIEKVDQGYFQLGAGLLDKLSLNSYSKTILEEKELDLPLATSEFDVLEDLNQVRRELVEIMEFKLHLVEEKRAKIQTKYEKLQQKFSWLLASQVALFLMIIGCTSLFVKMQEEVAQNPDKIKLINTFQSTR